MATLSPRARRHEDEIDLATRERDARHIVELAGSWGLSRDERTRVPAADDVRLHLDGFDGRADVRTVADVWAQVRSRRFQD